MMATGRPLQSAGRGREPAGRQKSTSNLHLRGIALSISDQCVTRRSSSHKSRSEFLSRFTTEMASYSSISSSSVSMSSTNGSNGGYRWLLFVLAFVLMILDPCHGIQVNSDQAAALLAIRSQWESAVPGLASWKKGQRCRKWLFIRCNLKGMVMSINLFGQSDLAGYSLPDEFTKITSLTTLNLQSNGLLDNIPAGISALSNLKRLILSNNFLSGPLPPGIGALKKLKLLDLSTNRLNDSLPEALFQCTSLTTLALSKNTFSDSIPTNISSLQRLRNLMLHSNSLVGTLPETIGSMKWLRSLDVGANGFFGAVPPNITTLRFLVFLDVSANKLTGTPPTVFSSWFIGTPQGTLNLQRNFFSGQSSEGFKAGRRKFCPTYLLGTYALKYLMRYGANPRSTVSRNCLTSSLTCLLPNQKAGRKCLRYCGAGPFGLFSKPCNGHGTCTLTPTSMVPQCECESGWYTTTKTFTLPFTGITTVFSTCTSTLPSGTPNTKSKTGNWTRGITLTNASPGSLFNPTFRHASRNFIGNASYPDWTFPDSVDWRTSAVTPMQDMGTCSACWAFSTLSAVESAIAISNSTSPVPLSAQFLLNCGGGNCEGGIIPDALQFVANLPRTTLLGLPPSIELNYTAAYSAGTCPTPSLPSPVVSSYESMPWRTTAGLLLAVQAQPVIVMIESDQPSFMNFTGSSIYADSTCFANGRVDHAVVIVGFSLEADLWPYWIIRNSWGTDWGDGGYMKMAIIDGPGICGINTMPAYYPIAQNSSCNPNPCGSGTCTVTGSSPKNTCSCPQDFVAVTNIDDTQSCVLKAVCSSFAFNPCGSGVCVNDGSGQYHCICPAGLTSGTRADGLVTCLFGSTPAGYTSAAGDTCTIVSKAFSLTASDFTSLNPSVNCNGVLPVGTALTVSTGSNLPGCNVTYTVSETQATCDTVAVISGITAANITAYNPGIACDNIALNDRVCIQPGTPPAFTCTSYVTVEDGDSCLSIEQDNAITAADLFYLNPGILCGNHMVAVPQMMIGEQVCVGSFPIGAVNCKYGKYSVVRGDSCSSIVSKKFKGSVSLMTTYNPGFVCTNSALYVGKSLCLPP